MEEQIQDFKERLEEEESAATALSAHKRKLEAELMDLKRDLEGLELTLAKSEKEKQVKPKGAFSKFIAKPAIQNGSCYRDIIHCLREIMTKQRNTLMNISSDIPGPGYQSAHSDSRSKSKR